MRKISRRRSRSSRLHTTWPFHVLLLLKTAKKCAKIYNARAQPLFCSLNLLFGDVLVAVAVLFCVKVPIVHYDGAFTEFFGTEMLDL